MTTTAQRSELVNLVFQAATVERQAQHHGTYRYLCEIDGDYVFTHRPWGNVLRVLD